MPLEDTGLDQSTIDRLLNSDPIFMQKFQIIKDKMIANLGEEASKIGDNNPLAISKSEGDKLSKAKNSILDSMLKLEGKLNLGGFEFFSKRDMDGITSLKNGMMLKLETFNEKLNVNIPNIDIGGNSPKLPNALKKPEGVLEKTQHLKLPTKEKEGVLEKKEPVVIIGGFTKEAASKVLGMLGGKGKGGAGGNAVGDMGKLEGILGKMKGSGGVAGVLGTIGTGLYTAFKLFTTFKTLGGAKGIMGMFMKGLQGLIKGPLGKLAKNPVTWLVFSIIQMTLDAFRGMNLAKRWGTSKTAGVVGAVLGGTGKGLSGMFVGMGKWAAVGVKIGMPGGPPGMIAGGLIGAAIGGILGFIGGKKIAKGLNAVGLWFKKGWNAIVDSIKAVFSILLQKFAKPIEFLKKAFGAYVKLMKKTFESIKDAFFHPIETVKKAISAIGNIFKKAFSIYVNMVKNTFGLLKKLFFFPINLITIVIGKLFGVVKKSFSAYVSNLKKTFGFIKDLFFHPIDTIKTAIGKLFGVVKKAFSLYISAVKKTFGLLKDAFFFPINLIKGVITKIAGTVKATFGRYVNIVKSTFGFFKDLFFHPIDTIKGVIEKVKGFLGNLGPKLLGTIKDVFLEKVTAIKDFFLGFISKLNPLNWFKKDPEKEAKKKAEQERKIKEKEETKERKKAESAERAIRAKASREELKRKLKSGVFGIFGKKDKTTSIDDKSDKVATEARRTQDEQKVKKEAKAAKNAKDAGMPGPKTPEAKYIEMLRRNKELSIALQEKRAKKLDELQTKLDNETNERKRKKLQREFSARRNTYRIAEEFIREANRGEKLEISEIKKAEAIRLEKVKLSQTKVAELTKSKNDIKDALSKDNISKEMRKTMKKTLKIKKDELEKEQSILDSVTKKQEILGTQHLVAIKNGVYTKNEFKIIREGDKRRQETLRKKEKLEALKKKLTISPSKSFKEEYAKAKANRIAKTKEKAQEKALQKEKDNAPKISSIFDTYKNAETSQKQFQTKLKSEGESINKSFNAFRIKKDNENNQIAIAIEKSNKYLKDSNIKIATNEENRDKYIKELASELATITATLERMANAQNASGGGDSGGYSIDFGEVREASYDASYANRVAYYDNKR